MYSKIISDLILKFVLLKAEEKKIFSIESSGRVIEGYTKSSVSWDHMLSGKEKSEKEIVADAIGTDTRNIIDRNQSSEEVASHTSMVKTERKCCEEFDYREYMKRIRLEIDGMDVSMTRLQSKDKGSLINIVGVIFKCQEDTSAWIETNLPSSLPFGCFVDVNSF